jgi:hypothetical protein
VNLIFPELVKKFPAFHGTWRFRTAFTRALFLSVSWARSIQRFGIRKLDKFVDRLLIIRLPRKGLCAMNLVISLLASQLCLPYFLRLSQGMRCMPWKCLFCVYCTCLLWIYVAAAAACVLLCSLGKYVDGHIMCSSLLKTAINTVMLIDLSLNHEQFYEVVI